MVIVVFLIGHWYLSLFFQSFFLHRYASHNMFKMNLWVEKVFFLLTFIFQGSSFLHPAAYAVLHRRHHEFADTKKDPHSPHIIKNIFEFQKRTFIVYRDLVSQFQKNEITARNVPRWPFLENLAESMVMRGIFIITYTLIYLVYAPSPWFYLLIPVHILMGPIHGFIVNWFGHLWGYRNFNEQKDNSKNTLPVDVLMMGELYQNNHHKSPQERNFAVRWFEIDLGHLFSALLVKFNIIELNKVK